MAESYTLDAQSRTVLGKKVKTLRAQGLVPAVIYGAKIEPVHVQIPYRPLQVALMKAGGTHLIDITVEKDTHTVLAREVQRHVIRGDILHVDFLAVQADVKITADVQVQAIGESPIVESRQGSLTPGVTSLTIEALPRNLISEIQVDISGLTEVGDSIFVSDLDLDDTITVLADPEDLLFRISPMHVVTEEEGEDLDEEPTSAEPEVISRGREEEEEDE